MLLQLLQHNVGPSLGFGKSTFVFLDKLGEDGKRKNRAADESAARFVVATLKFSNIAMDVILASVLVRLPSVHQAAWERPARPRVHC